MQDLVQIEAGQDRNGESQAQPQGDPVAQRLTQLTPTALQRLISRPDALQSWNLTLVGSLMFDDFIPGQFHGLVDIARKQGSLLGLHHLQCWDRYAEQLATAPIRRLLRHDLRNADLITVPATPAS